MKSKIEEFLKDRIKDNGKLFNKEEIELLERNQSLCLKVYLMGIMDERNSTK